MRRAALALLALVVLAWIGGGLWFMANRATLYHPFDTATYPPSLAGAGVRAVSHDGLDLWVKPPVGDRPLILYFGGNVGNPGRNAPVLAEYVVNGFGIVAMHYRPEARRGDLLVADALRVAEAVAELTGIPPDRTVIHGLSLGSGIATQVALTHPAAGLILEAPFTRLCDMPGTVAPLYPYCLLSPGDALPTVEAIGALSMPLLVQHGGADRLIPLAMGQAVFAAAPEPRRLDIYPEGDHNDLRLHGAGIAARAFALEVTR